jgi:hypothetical protein
VAENRKKRNPNVRKRRFNKTSKAQKAQSSTLIAQPLVKCELCNETIENIAEAISEGLDKFSHFDCVIKKISENEKLSDKQKISYIGRGIFAVVEQVEENQYNIVKEIAYESPQDFQKMKVI